VISALGLTQHPLLSHVIMLLKQDLHKLNTQVDFIPGKALVKLISLPFTHVLL
jgi:hypothetical protein